jgi:16S rRNA (cytidine1402-2'-O)-methyltransferase
VARGLTLASCDVHSDTVKGWRSKPAAADERAPAVFAIGR